jgi:ubiquinone/menaquinone biosynthesis C-methylase UbiE/predicted ester cyclase
MPTATADHAETARRALEQVCSGRDLDGIARDYHPDFVDHVNRFTYRGHAGARQSVGLYLELFPDLSFEVEDQVSEDQKVASRWRLRGTHKGREVELRGIVISRFSDGRIIEDWAASDTMELVRQLGLRLTIALAVKHRKLIFNSESTNAGPGTIRHAVDRITCRFRKDCAVRPSETERIRKIFEKQAPKYDESMSRFERWLFAGNREWVGARAERRILDIAAGTARNLPFYSPDANVTGIELSSEMAALGRQRAEDLGRELEMVVGDATDLPFAEDSFDTVVCTYGLCTIPDDAAAVREAKRVLRPGGRILLAEHVRSPNRVVRTIQRIVEPFAHRFGGDHLLREPLEHLEAEGFEVEELERQKAGWVELVAARKPA